jgi:hypothetical protein
MKPETRGRTSTVATAAKRPVYSSHSVISLCSGFYFVRACAGSGASRPRAFAMTNWERICNGIPRLAQPCVLRTPRNFQSTPSTL